MHTSETDENLITHYKKGNKEVFKFLIDRYTSPIYNFSAQIVGKDNAADIVQEVFIKIWKKIDKFDQSKSSFKTWIFTIAKNTSIDFLRKKRSFTFSSLENIEEKSTFEERIMDEEILPDEVIQKIQDKEFLNKILEVLSVEYRTVLTLHYQEEMTFEEIAEILNKPLNTVKSYHFRAIKKLRKMANE
jgi:RNA polymerase sigma-70 factor (ECF subfamily)